MRLIFSSGKISMGGEWLKGGISVNGAEWDKIGDSKEGNLSEKCGKRNEELPEQIVRSEGKGSSVGTPRRTAAKM